MTNNKQEAIESVRPFIRYLHNLSLPRKIGFSFFVKTCSMTPGNVKAALASREGAYKALFAESIHMPALFVQGLVLVSCILFILSVANSAPYLYYFFVSVLLLFSVAFSFVIKMSAISKAGLGLQFRIPENFQRLARLIEDNRHGMAISKSANVRYSAVAFKDVLNGDLDPFKLVAVINGVIEHFGIADQDVANSGEDVIEQMLNEKSVSGA